MNTSINIKKVVGIAAVIVGCAAFAIYINTSFTVPSVRQEQVAATYPSSGGLIYNDPVYYDEYYDNTIPIGIDVKPVDPVTPIVPPVVPVPVTPTPTPPVVKVENIVTLDFDLGKSCVAPAKSNSKEGIITLVEDLKKTVTVKAQILPKSGSGAAQVGSRCIITVDAKITNLDARKLTTDSKTSASCVGKTSCSLDITFNKPTGSTEQTSNHHVTFTTATSPECYVTNGTSKLANGTQALSKSAWIVTLASKINKTVFEYGGIGNGQLTTQYTLNYIKKTFPKLADMGMVVEGWGSKTSMDLSYASIKKYATTNLYKAAADEVGLKIDEDAPNCRAYPKVMISGFSHGGIQAMQMAHELGTKDGIRTNTIFLIDGVPSSFNGTAICTNRFNSLSPCVKRHVSYFQHEDLEFFTATKWMASWLQWGRRGREIIGGEMNVPVTFEKTAKAGTKKFNPLPGEIPFAHDIDDPLNAIKNWDVDALRKSGHIYMISDKDIADQYGREALEIIGKTETSYTCDGSKLPKYPVEEGAVISGSGGLPGMLIEQMNGTRPFVWPGDFGKPTIR